MKGVIFMTESKAIESECLNGIYIEFANLLGMDAAMKIHSVFRGQQVFFPVELFSKEFIRNQIISEFNGANVKQLATKYGYTEKWIKKILKESVDKCGESKMPLSDADERK